MWKLGLDRQVAVAELRERLAAEQVVPPPAWFQAMLAQGVLLLNAALTASIDDSLLVAQHTAFWRPVIEGIVRGILEEKATAPDLVDRSVVFAWWGTHARALRSVVEGISAQYPAVRVGHLDHVNPAAQGDAFCDGDPLGSINGALARLGAAPIDWLPSVGWDAGHEDAPRMAEFIADTMEAHQQYLERLQGVAYERADALPQISGVLSTPAVPFLDAVRSLLVSLPNLGAAVQEAAAFARTHLTAASRLEVDEIAALHLYTTQTAVFRALNAALRDPAREKVPLFTPYLRLLLGGIGKLAAQPTKLYRGVSTDLRGRYPIGRTVVWWGVSSCSSDPDIAHKFHGRSGKRTLFAITPKRAVLIRPFSKYQVEEEYVLAPGTQLHVDHVVNEPGGLTRIELTEVDGPRLVS